MREYAVDYYLDAALIGFFDELFEVVGSAEIAVDAHIVTGVVLMVGVRLEYRREVNARNSEVFEVCKLFGYAFEVAAEKVDVAYLAVAVGAVFGHAAPIVAIRRVVLCLMPFAADKEPVGHYLVHDAAVDKARAIRVRRYRELPISALAEQCVQVDVAADAVELFLVLYLEMIEIKSRRRYFYRKRVGVLAVLVLDEVHRVSDGRFAVFDERKENLGGVLRPREAERERYRLAHRRRACGRLVRFAVREILYYSVHICLL